MTHALVYYSSKTWYGVCVWYHVMNVLKRLVFFYSHGTGSWLIQLCHNLLNFLSILYIFSKNLLFSNSSLTVGLIFFRPCQRNTINSTTFWYLKLIIKTVVCVSKIKAIFHHSFGILAPHFVCVSSSRAYHINWSHHMSKW